MIGERIRHIRQGQGRSLADIAKKAKISVATLSRIENDKQALELGLFLELAKILDCRAHEILGDDGDGDGIGALVRTIGRFEAGERMRLWRDLAASRRTVHSRSQRARVPHLVEQLDELVAQLDFMREELDNVRRRLRRSTKSR